MHISDNSELKQSLIRRYQTLEKLEADPELQAIALARAAKDPCWWFNTFCWTYDPRGTSNGLPAYLPFDLFPRQEELIRWLAETAPKAGTIDQDLAGIGAPDAAAVDRLVEKLSGADAALREAAISRLNAWPQSAAATITTQPRRRGRWARLAGRQRRSKPMSFPCRRSWMRFAAAARLST